MKAAKREKLGRRGWKAGDAADFLHLSAEEQTLIDLKIRLGRMLKTRRVDNHWTQQELARRVRSSQSRVAKMEAGHPTVSLDLLIRSLLVAGASRRQLAKAMGE